MRIFAFLISMLTSFFTGVIAYDTHNIHIQNYVFKSKKIKKTFSFAFLSDLHAKDFGYDNEAIVRSVIDAQVDAVIMSGDMLTSKHGLKVDEAFALVKRLASICPVYYGIGNHEARLNWEAGNYYMSYEEYLDIIRECGAIVLDNDSTLLEEFGITLSGLSLPARYYHGFGNKPLDAVDVKKFVGAKDDNYNILIAHNPEHRKAYDDYGADLTLAGHLHGGVMRLWGNYGAITPRFRIFPGYAGGVIKGRRGRMIISRGLGLHTIPVRVFNPCELDFVTIVKKES